MEQPKYVVNHNEEAKRFEVEMGGALAKSEYIRAADRIIFTHTEVPVSMEGQGIASKLAKAGLEFAKANKLSVMPLCPFVAGYIKSHPEYKTLLQKGFSVD